LILLVTLILVYGSFISARLPDGSMLVTQMRSELAYIGIPLFFIIILIPFYADLLRALPSVLLGPAFPIVLSLIGLEPTAGELLATTVLAYGAGYTGMILSPVHICLIVTNEHFQTSIGSSLLRLMKPAMAILAASIVMYFSLLYFFRMEAISFCHFLMGDNTRI
jgi:hypothetical protein